MAEVRFGPDRALSARTLAVLPVLLAINGVALVAVGAVLGATVVFMLAAVSDELAGWLMGLTLEFLPGGVGLSLWVLVGVAWGVGLIWAERRGSRRRLLTRVSAWRRHRLRRTRSCTASCSGCAPWPTSSNRRSWWRGTTGRMPSR
jgi:hypothetical protein